MADRGRVVLERLDGVALLTFAGQTAFNGIDEAMWRALADAVGQCANDPSVRCVVLTGAGHVAFATDPGEPDPALQAGTQPREGAAVSLDAARTACEALARCDRPIIARIRGECIGAGVVVALHADLRIAAQDSAFALSWDRAAALGVEPLLVRTVGDTAARFLLLTGSRIDTDEALRMGLVTRMIRDAELSDAVADLARLLVDQPEGAAASVKRALADASSGNAARAQP